MSLGLGVLLRCACCLTVFTFSRQLSVSLNEEALEHLTEVEYGHDQAEFVFPDGVVDIAVEDAVQSEHDDLFNALSLQCTKDLLACSALGHQVEAVSEKKSMVSKEKHGIGSNLLFALLKMLLKFVGKHTRCFLTNGKLLSLFFCVMH